MAEFHFGIPVLPKVMAADGERWLAADNPDGRSVENTLNHCLRSLLNQTAASSCIVHIACHELPPLHVPTDRIVVHRVDFPRPPDIDLDTYNRLSGKVLPKLPDVRRRRIGDKYSKVKSCLRSAFSDPEARWWMIVDADDLVHRDIAAYALEHDGLYPGGHTVTKGYGWAAGTDFFRELGGFHKTCGTCNTVRLSDEDREIWAATRDLHAFERKKHWLFAGHASVFQRLRNRGDNTAKFPFRAAVYTTATGANYSGTKRAGSGHVSLTAELRAQFGIQEDA